MVDVDWASILPPPPGGRRVSHTFGQLSNRNDILGQPSIPDNAPGPSSRATHPFGQPSCQRIAQATNHINAFGQPSNQNNTDGKFSSQRKDTFSPPGNSTNIFGQPSNQNNTFGQPSINQNNTFGQPSSNQTYTFGQPSSNQNKNYQRVDIQPLNPFQDAINNARKQNNNDNDNSQPAFQSSSSSSSSSSSNALQQNLNPFCNFGTNNDNQASSTSASSTFQAGGTNSLQSGIKDDSQNLFPRNDNPQAPPQANASNCRPTFANAVDEDEENVYGKKDKGKGKARELFPSSPPHGSTCAFPFTPPPPLSPPPAPPPPLFQGDHFFEEERPPKPSPWTPLSPRHFAHAISWADLRAARHADSHLSASIIRELVVLLGANVRPPVPPATHDPAKRIVFIDPCFLSDWEERGYPPATLDQWQRFRPRHDGGVVGCVMVYAPGPAHWVVVYVDYQAKGAVLFDSHRRAKHAQQTEEIIRHFAQEYSALFPADGAPFRFVTDQNCAHQEEVLEGEQGEPDAIASCGMYAVRSILDLLDHRIPIQDRLSREQMAAFRSNAVSYMSSVYRKVYERP